MKLSTTALAAALFAQSIVAIAAEAPPLNYDIFVRGAFNGWGTDNRLAWKGKGVYEADILVSPGNHAFKIGSKDWAAEWVANPSASVAVALDKNYPLATEAGPEDYMFSRQTAAFRFREMLAGVPGGVDVLSGKRFELAKELRLPAMASIILELDGAR